MIYLSWDIAHYPPGPVCALRPRSGHDSAFDFKLRLILPSPLVFFLLCLLLLPCLLHTTNFVFCFPVKNLPWWGFGFPLQDLIKLAAAGLLALQLSVSRSMVREGGTQRESPVVCSYPFLPFSISTSSQTPATTSSTAHILQTTPYDHSLPLSPLLLPLPTLSFNPSCLNSPFSYSFYVFPSFLWPFPSIFSIPLIPTSSLLPLSFYTLLPLLLFLLFSLIPHSHSLSLSHFLLSPSQLLILYGPHLSLSPGLSFFRVSSASSSLICIPSNAFPILPAGLFPPFLLIVFANYLWHMQNMWPNSPHKLH